MSSQFSQIASSINYFNSLLNQQILQNRFNSALGQGQTKADAQNSTTALNSALNSLAGLLSASKSGSPTPAGLTESSIENTVNQLVDEGADMNLIQDLLTVVTGDTGDILFTRTNSSDPYISLDNMVKITGADLQSFLSQASTIAQRGEDINQYLETAANVVSKGDYDDFRRFISVTNTVMYRGQAGDLEKFYDFTDDILDKRHYDMESNIFSLQTMMSYGASFDTAHKIMSQMENTGLEGRNNMVDLNRVTIDARKQGAYLPYVFNEMANSGDTRAFMDAYMAENGMETTAPDFEKFDRIERIDGEDMVITKGESAALFAQAISSVDGLLPESVLYWSSLQTGAMDNGSSYLDLSKLEAGVYDIYVKIGGYYGGTDTAKKRVIVLDENSPMIDGGDSDPSCDDDTKVKNNNGLGDTKDSDNTVKFDDSSNPGKGNDKAGQVGNNNKLTTDEIVEEVTKPGTGAEIIQESNKPLTQAVKNDDPVAKKTVVEEATKPGTGAEIIKELAKGLEQAAKKNDPVAVNALNGFRFEQVENSQPIQNIFTPPLKEPADLEKMYRLYDLCKCDMTANDVYDFIDKKVGKDHVVDFLNSIGQSNLADKYEDREVKWFDMLLAMGKDPDFYQKATAEFRSLVKAEEAKEFFLEKGLEMKAALESLWLLGYRDYNDKIDTNLEESSKAKNNNGLGDTKDSDNTVKFEDSSNPGHNKTKEVETNNLVTPTPDDTDDVETVTPTLNPNPPANLQSLVKTAKSSVDEFVSSLESGDKLKGSDVNKLTTVYLNRIFDSSNESFNSLVSRLKDKNNSSQDTLFVMRLFQQQLDQIYNNGGNDNNSNIVVNDPK